MPANWRQFNRQVAAAAKEFRRREYETFIKKLGFDLLLRIVQKTPVDTGRARGNWRVSINSMPERPIEREDKGGHKVINEEGRKITGAEFEIGDVIYISNSLPYAEPLENGHSGQAPQGMVQLSIDEVESRL